MKKLPTILVICAISGTAFSQNFGIDQPNPTEKLDVNGNIKASGNVTANAVYAPNMLLQTKYNIWTATTTTTTNQTYVDATGSDLSITAKRTGSIFKISVIAEGYQSGGNGCNIGIKYVNTNTLVAGVNGSSGESWAGAGNGATTTSWNITRVTFHNPGVVAGNTYTYRAMLGRWTAGTVWLNYPGYNLSSIIIIEEIAQ